MSIESKIEVIKAEKESAIQALTLYLDSIYNMTDKFFDIRVKEDGKGTERVLKEGLEPDAKVEGFIKELNSDATEYESIRGKLQSDDFNLSLTEIARIGLAFTYSGIVIQKQIETSQKALGSIKKIIDSLMDGETQKVDFSQKD